MGVNDVLQEVANGRMKSEDAFAPMLMALAASTYGNVRADKSGRYLVGECEDESGDWVAVVIPVPQSK